MNWTTRKKVIIALLLIMVLGVIVFWLFSTIRKYNSAPVVITPVANQASTTASAPVISASLFYHYIQITCGCGPYYDLTPCVNMRSGPGTEYPVMGRLRNGVVLAVDSTTVQGGDLTWYKIIFDKTIRYPERVTGDWYVAVDSSSVLPLVNIGDEFLTSKTATTSKRVEVYLSKEMLYAYDGDKLFMQEPISTGLDTTPTSVGTFKVYKKTPSRYMQGPLPGVSDQVYDLPGVPWNLYFTPAGDVIHGAYWHNHFGEPWSHGCVNLSPDNAKKLYLWADIGTKVIVAD